MTECLLYNGTVLEKCSKDRRARLFTFIDKAERGFKVLHGEDGQDSLGRTEQHSSE